MMVINEAQRHHFMFESGQDIRAKMKKIKKKL